MCKFYLLVLPYKYSMHYFTRDKRVGIEKYSNQDSNPSFNAKCGVFFSTILYLDEIMYYRKITRQCPGAGILISLRGSPLWSLMDLICKMKNVPVEDYEDMLSLDNCPDVEMSLREWFQMWNDLITGIDWPHPSCLPLQCSQTFWTGQTRNLELDLMVSCSV